MLCWEVYKGQPWTPANTPSWSLAELIQTSVSLCCTSLYAWLWEGVWPARRQLTSSWAHCSGSAPAQTICLFQMSCPSERTAVLPWLSSQLECLYRHTASSQQWITETTATQHFISTPYCHLNYLLSHVSDIYILKKNWPEVTLQDLSPISGCVYAYCTEIIEYSIMAFLKYVYLTKCLFPPTDLRATSQSKWVNT